MNKTSTNILSKYENMWVAIDSDRNKVYASAKGVLALEKKLKSLKIKKDKLIMTWVFPLDGSFSP